MLLLLFFLGGGDMSLFLICMNGISRSGILSPVFFSFLSLSRCLADDYIADDHLCFS